MLAGSREHTLEKDKRKLHRERYNEIQEMADEVKQRREAQRRREVEKDAQIAKDFDKIQHALEEERKKGRKIALAYHQRQSAVLSQSMRDRQPVNVSQSIVTDWNSDLHGPFAP